VKKGVVMRQIRLICVVVAVLSFFAFVNAGTQVSVSTDKSYYQPGETVHIFVSAYNPASTEITLGFGTSLQATYLLDGIYQWDKNKIFTTSPISLTIQPFQTYTWQFDHDAQEQNYYPLAVGNHSVLGIVKDQYSEPATFQVIPEPTSMLLLGLGGLLIRRKK
jgi:hypothetical protein